MTNVLFKLSVAAPMELDDVVSAADAVPTLASEKAEVRGIELQRIDRGEESTVVFFTGGEDSARAFRKAVKQGDRKARITKANEKELLSPEPVRK